MLLKSEIHRVLQKTHISNTKARLLLRLFSSLLNCGDHKDERYGHNPQRRTSANQTSNR